MVDVETCPSLEQIAAFLDGRLTSRERARLTEHLADCPTCLEVLAGAADFLASEEAPGTADSLAPERGRSSDEATAAPPTAPLSFPRPEPGDGDLRRRRPVAVPPRWGRRLGTGLAAAALLAAVAAPILMQRPWKPSVAAGLVNASLRQPRGASAGAIRDLIYKADVMRGPSDSPSSLDDQAFMLGVHVVDLRIALAAGDRDTASEVARRILVTIGKDTLFGPKVTSFYPEARAALDRQPAVDARGLLTRADAAESELEELSPTYLALGRWVEAARLATTPSGDPSFLHSRETRRFLEWVLSPDRKEDSLDDATKKELAGLRHDLSAAAGEELAQIIKRHEHRRE